MKTLIGLLLSISAFAGQSIIFGTNLIQNTSVPNTPTSRVEFYLHDWATNGSTFHVVEASNTGWRAYTQISGSSVTLVLYNQWETGGQLAQFEIGNLVPKAIYVRLQHNPATKTDLIEAWDINGNHISSNTFTYASEVNPGGTTFQMGFGSEPVMNVAFMRLHTTLLPLNSRPPTTVDNANRVFEWKFDGNLIDSAPSGLYPASMTGPSYVNPTPYTNVIAVVKTADANTWANVLPQRAGFPGILDGTFSYSQNDTSPNVNYFWTQTGGPSQIQFSSRTSGTPSITGTIFGDYPVKLTVTDAGGLIAVASDHIGVVAMDSKGIAVNASSTGYGALPDDVLGNMMGFGKNPWQFQDKWTQYASQLRAIQYASPSIGAFGETYPGWSTLKAGCPDIVEGCPQWEHFGQGTTAYYFNGRGDLNAWDRSAVVTTSGTTSATSTTLVVNDTSVFVNSSYPTRLLVNDGTFTDELRVCSVANATTYNLCYDPYPGTRHAFASGSNVLQSRIQGTSTLFLTDPVTAVCPSGGGGALPGIASYSTGTVSLTANSNVITAGGGAIWMPPTTQAVGFVQVSATHTPVATPIPFTFVAQILTGGAGATATANGAGGSLNTVFPTPSGGSALYGSNYVVNFVTVVVTDPTGSGASITANVVGGLVTSYTINSGGTNYTKPVVQIQPTKMVLARVFPADADTASGLSYKIMPWTRTLDIISTNPVDSNGTRELLWPVTGCESETDMYINTFMFDHDSSGVQKGVGNSFYPFGHDIGVLDGRLQSGRQYSITDTGNWVTQSGTFGNINFYSEDMANWALYFRTGLTAPKIAAKVLSDWWARSPFADFCCSLALSVGGGRIGAFIAVITGQTTSITWQSDLRLFASEGRDMVESIYNNGSYRCSFDDSRDVGYLYAQLILAAIWDPENVAVTTAPGGIPWRTYWQNALVHMQANDTACAGSNGSFSDGQRFAPVYQLVMTANSPAVTAAVTTPATVIPATFCPFTASGTATVVNGSASMTINSGSLPAGDDTTAIFITGTNGGVPFVQYLAYTGPLTSVASLSTYWAGDNGSVTWMAGTGVDNNASNGNTMRTFAEGNDDTANLSKSWGCIWNSGTSITLNRSWDGVSTSGSHTFYGYQNNLSGYGQQPFMLGIRTYGQSLLANQNVTALASYKAPYLAFQNNAAAWVWNTGMDPVTLTTNYGVFNQSSPVTIPTVGSNFLWRSPGSNYGLLPAGFPAAREQNTETGYAHIAYYLANSTGPNKTQADMYYGAVWGDCAFSVGVFCVSTSTAANPNQDQLSDASIANGKWFGFFAGMGQSHRWPAARLGGVDSATISTVYVPFTLTGVTNSTQVRLSMLSPTGVVTTQLCSSSPCAGTVDHRTGSVLMKLDYLNGSSVVIAAGDYVPFYVQ